jgi:hypothetical protein
VAGYSGTPLLQKLGIKDPSTLLLCAAPAGVFAEVPAGVQVKSQARGKVDVAVAFFTQRRQLENRIESLEKAIFPNGGLWIAWPKKASGMTTDITDDVVRAVALPRGLVDNKVCAIDDTWTGLRLVWRVQRRE